MLVNRVVFGWVFQEYDTDTGKCVQQSFMESEEEPHWEDSFGNEVDEVDGEEFPINLVQPKE